MIEDKFLGPTWTLGYSILEIMRRFVALPWVRKLGPLAPPACADRWGRGFPAIRRSRPGRKTSDAVKLSSCLAEFLGGGGEGGGFVVVLAGGQAVVEAAEEAAEQVALGGGVPVAGVAAAVVAGAGAGAG